MSMENPIDRVPDAVIPKQRRGALVRVVGSLLGLLVLTGIVIVSTAVWGWSVFTAEGPLLANKTVNFPAGASRTEIAERLMAEGVISNVTVMNAASTLDGMRGASLKSGEYEFAAHATMANVLTTLASGKVITYKITVPEGWTTTMALARINSNDVLAGDTVPPSAIAEGAVMADTFVFRRGMTKQKLVADMVASQTKMADELWARKAADTPLKSREEMVTLASIVEKETGIAEERPRVAAVFLNRLKKGMKLQSDPTIIYGLVGGQGKLDRPLTRADIDGVTAFNTYQIAGLPPSPIANPGRAAMEAVIAPAPTDDIYFVADGSGGHAFAATLEGHNANVKKWREFQKNGILLPGDKGEANTPAATETAQTTAEAPAGVAVESLQPELPSPEVPAAPAVEAVALPASGADDAAIAEAAANKEKTQEVPTSVAAAATPDQSVVTKPVAANPPPLPVEKKLKAVKEVVATVAKPAVAPVVKPEAKSAVKPVAKPVAAKASVLQPGSVIKVGARFIPIPLQKKKKKP